MEPEPTKLEPPEAAVGLELLLEALLFELPHAASATATVTRATAMTAKYHNLFDLPELCGLRIAVSLSLPWTVAGDRRGGI